MDAPLHERILVTGATGGIGRQLVDRLTVAGAPVVAMCRRQKQIDDFAAQGITAVRGDLEDTASLQAAMAGADRLFLLTFPGPTQRQQGRNAVEAAVAAGVRRVVHLSTADANPRSAIPWAAAPAATDELLKASALEWTLLKPTAFMQNLAQSALPIRYGLLPQTSGRGQVGWIDTADIAAVATEVLLHDGHQNRELILTGPQLLSMPQVAAELSTVIGHRVRYVHLPSRVFSTLLRLSGTDVFTARGLRHQFVDVFRNGQDDGAVMTDTVHAVTGTPPRSIRDFAQSHRELFARS